MPLSFLPMKSTPSVSISTAEVSSASVTVSNPTISVSNNFDGGRAVIPFIELEDTVKRMEDAIPRLGSILNRFIHNPTSIKRGDDRSIRIYLNNFSVNDSQSEIDGTSSDDEYYPQQRCNRGSRNCIIQALLPAKETESK